MSSEWSSGFDVPDFPNPLYAGGDFPRTDAGMEFDIVRTDLGDQPQEAPAEIPIVPGAGRTAPATAEDAVELAQPAADTQPPPVPVHLSAELSQEIREAVADLPLYGEGPGVDYTYSQEAYAANVTLFRDPGLRYNNETGQPEPSDAAEVLLVQRGAGDGSPGVWGGVSGYIDTVHDPAGGPDEAFDPVRHTVRNELSEEGTMPEDGIDQIDFRIGERFTEPRRNGGTLHVVPVVGIVEGEPVFAVDGHELTDQQWVRVREVADIQNLSPGYLQNTLRSALGGLGLRADTVIEWLGLAEQE